MAVDATDPLIGENICKPLRSLRMVLPIIRHHHEHWNGTGYPDRLAGESIPLLARILQVVDVYDALRTERPYKTAHSHEHAHETMRRKRARSVGRRDRRKILLPAGVARERGVAWARGRILFLLGHG